MMKKFFLSLLFGCLVSGILQAQVRQQNSVKEPELLDYCKPLLAPDCVIDDFVSEVDVLSGGGNGSYSFLLDADLTNVAQMNLKLVDVGLLYKPIVSVRDLKHKYKGGEGQKAGFVLEAENGLLNIEILNSLRIELYKENELVYSANIESNGALLSLSLLNNSKALKNIQINVPENIIFDELMLSTTGVNVGALKSLKVYYAFVGKDEIRLSGDGYTSDHEELLNDQDKGYTNWGIGILAGPIDAWVQLPKGEFKEPGIEVGFVYSNTGLINVSLKKTIIFYNTTTNEQETHSIEAGLGVDVAASTKVRFSAIPKIKWNKVKISVAGLDVLSYPTLYYAYVKDIRIPAEAKKHDLNLSADALICGGANAITLSAGVSIKEWKLIKVTAPDNKTDITEKAGSFVSIKPNQDSVDGRYTADVNFELGAPQGIYSFQATDDDGCTGIIRVTRGKTDAMKEATRNFVGGTVLHGKKDGVVLSAPPTGSLISIDQLENSENILDGNLTTYASYNKGLQLIAHTGIVSIRKMEGNFSDKHQVVGFVMETPPELLGLDALKFYGIALYDESGKQIYSSVISENNTVQASLLGAPGSGKMRYVITVPEECRGKYKEFTLFTTGLLNLQTGKSLKIFGAMVADTPDAIQSNNPLDMSGVVQMKQDNGSRINYSKTGTVGVANVVSVFSGLGYLIEQQTVKPEKGAVSYALVEALTANQISVKAGRLYPGGSWVGMVIKKPAGVADVSVLQNLGIRAYNKGRLVGDSDDGSLLVADVIGWGDYAYFTCYVSQAFDEVSFRKASTVGASQSLQYLGFYTYADADGDGIPDEIDPDFCEPPLIIEVEPMVAVDLHAICKGQEHESLLVSLNGTPGTEVQLKIRDFDRDTLWYHKSFTIESKDTIKEEIDITDYTYGRYEMEFIPSGVIFEPVKEYFTIHNTQTQWNPQNNSTDWNEWHNWTHGTPIAHCTDVIIPTGTPVYPVLKEKMVSGKTAYRRLQREEGEEGGDNGGPTGPSDPGTGNPSGGGGCTHPENKCLDGYGCRYIYFAPHTEVQNTHLLYYDKAWVDLKLNAGRYYMLAAPLKGMVTGDFFVPALMYGVQKNPLFEILDEESSPANRFNPRIYQRLWKNAAPVVKPVAVLPPVENQPFASEVPNEARGEVTFDQTLWTPPFNALKESYDVSKPFSLKADAPFETLVFRFPKEHTQYFYYNEKGQKTDLYETIVRNEDETGRFITEDETGKTVMPLQISFPASGTDNKVFLVGNPFMTHVNLEAFMRGNPDITSVKVYDGDVTNSLILIDGQLLTNMNDGQSVWTHVAPMQSFFVTVKEGAGSISQDGTVQKLTVTFSETMLENSPGTQMLRMRRHNAEPQAPQQGFAVRVFKDSVISDLRILFADSVEAAYCEGKDASVLIDEDLKPEVMVYTMADNQAVQLRRMPVADRVPLGVYVAHPGSVNLQVRTSEKGWLLKDWKTGKAYPLDSYPEIRIDGMQNSVGRLMLMREDDNLLQHKNQAYAYNTGNGYIRVVSSGTPIRSCAAYAADGKLLQQVAPDGCVALLREMKGVMLIRVVMQDGSQQQLKVLGF